MNRVESLALRCEELGIYNVQSEMKTPSVWFMGGGEIGVGTNEGTVRFSIYDVPMMIEELQGLYEDYKDLERQCRNLKSKRERVGKCKELLDRGFTYESIERLTGMSRTNIINTNSRMRCGNGK